MTRKVFLERNHQCRGFSINTFSACEVTLSDIVVNFGRLLSVGYSPSGVRFEFNTGIVTLNRFDQVDVY